MSEQTKYVSQESESKEYYFEEGCYILEMWNDSEKDPQVSIARARVPVGGTTKFHALTNTTERYVILAGSGLVEIGDSPPEPVQAGSVVIIPPSVRQRISNTGAADLVFLAICS